VWYPAAPDQASADELKLEPAQVKEALNVALTGKAGAVSGEIVAPESAGAAAALEVTVRQVLEQADGDGGVAPPAMPATVTGNVFSVADLPTPAVYEIVITSPGFDTRTFTETLAAGENKVINTITLSAAQGAVQGLVTDGNGVPLGAVEIAVRSGSFEKKTKTPTAGNVGSYVIDGLETPRTYVITFTLEGYASQTIALDLGSGQNLTKDVQILGGTGDVSGVVMDSAGNLLGGCAISITHGEFTAETSTLTASDAVGQQGSWSVTALPTPAPYAITANCPGFDGQTVLVLLPSAGSLTGVDMTLPKSSSSVTGVVSIGGTPAADVIVELSNGADPRTTATATSPAGAYRFADVAPGSYTLTFRKAGAKTRVVIVDVIADQTIARDVSLTLGS
jgi:hypothetical protein